MRRATRLCWHALAMIAAAVALPEAAAVPLDLGGGGSEAEASPAPQDDGASIETDVEEGADARIANRIERIFAELPGLSDVGVDVSEGVVKLSGDVADLEQSEQAEAIASRVTGVVTVANSIERDLSVGESLGVFQRLSNRIGGIIEMLPLIAVALISGLAVAALGYLIAAPASLWHRIAPNTFLAGLLQSAIRFAFVIGGLVVALDMIGAGALLGAVLGGAGVIGLALGFAMRDTVENYVSSVMLSLRQPFRANDHVIIDSHEGRVIRLTSRATVLMTLDGNHLRIPNSQVFKAVILNYTRNPQRRFEFDLGIDADDDATEARHVGLDALRALGFVLTDPPPLARVIEVGDSNIVIRFLGWIDQSSTDWYKAQSRAIPAVKVALEEAGFALPEPIYRLRFDGRTDPLPIGRSAKAGAVTGEDTPASKSRARTVTVTETAEDVAPEKDVAEMVDKERQGDGAEGTDLLDHSRPVE